MYGQQVVVVSVHQCLCVIWLFGRYYMAYAQGGQAAGNQPVKDSSQDAQCLIVSVESPALTPAVWRRRTTMNKII